MLNKFPLFILFKNGNSYCGEHEGMRYIIEPLKLEEDRRILRADIWPEPWSREKTPEPWHTLCEFGFDQAGLDDAVAWLNEQYNSRIKEWTDAMNTGWSEHLRKLREYEQNAQKEADEAVQTK